ncbi:HSF-type DNA-binding protein [Colletotrichum karsti]|uniref:HSF-type DNA-binding protein n=1 Tax=Colletotrichum karsti TaxID=1095194 RepID=A0A9P6LMM0_9PEZI|nr:HSF-type DNA-binding protein [Colletotrichum karsti]KAF9877637.1 HSF-type DNA-binding protein [Colletotrichum karsti]
MPMPAVQPPFPSPPGPGDQFLRWAGADGTGVVDAAAPPALNSYGIVPGQQQQFVQPTPSPNNALARRQINRALVPTAGRPNYDSTTDPWSFVGDDGALLSQPQQQTNGNMNNTDNIEVLEEMARKAMTQAQQKRKQIPPFVQKLSSFLDDDKNRDLIRWSEKGDSFIVLDEDEFAKKLIPDLFKHNNYASFVRQLNMYGFHKRVGLSDNSMRASERKNKSPSEYSNPFFRRGHPNLLWLINKPKSGNKGKKGGKNAEVEGDSEEDGLVEDGVAQGLGATSAPAGRALPPSGDMPIQKKEMALIREELAKLREQQRLIMTAIQRIQQDNSALYNQAVVFQSQHDRHQNSINAILNFLANVFRKTLEDQAGAQSVNDLLASIIPNGGSNNSSVPQGSVVDLGDYVQSQSGVANMNLAKRRQALPPIPNGRANTVSPSPASSAATPQPYNGREMGTVTELFDTTPGERTSSPSNYLAQELETNPHESMMRIIHDTNANSSSGIDLPQVVNNTPATMSQDQRNKMLNIMAGRTATPGSNRTPSTKPSVSASPHPPAPSVSPAPDAPTMPTTSGLSLSPIIGSAEPPPSLQQINFNSADLAALQRMQEEQAAKLDHLSSMLGPLSPSGHIPGIDENGNVNQNGGYFGNDLDIDQFLNADAYHGEDTYNGVNFGGDGNDFNFSLDGATPTAGVAGVNGTAINTPSSSSGTEEIPRDGFETYNGSPDRGIKRRRVD